MFDLLNALRRLLNTYTPFDSSRRSVKRSAPVEEPEYSISTKMRRLSKPFSDERYSSTSSDNSRRATTKRFGHNVYPTITLDDDDEDIVEIRDANVRKKPFTSTPAYNGVKNNGSNSAYFGNSAGTSGLQSRPVTNGIGTLESATNLLKRSRDAFARPRNSSSSKPSVVDLTFRLDEKKKYKELLEKSSLNVTYYSSNDTFSKYHTPVGKYYSPEGYRSRQMIDACKVRPKVVDSIDLTEDLGKRNKPRKSTSTAEAVIKVLDDFDNDAIVVKDSDSDVEILPNPPSPKPDFKVERVNSLKQMVDSCEFSNRKWLEDENEKLRRNRESNIKRTQELEICTRELNDINREIEQRCLADLVRDSLAIKDCYIIPEFEREEKVSLPELTPEQEDIITKALRAPRGQQIVTEFNLTITTEDIRTLDGQTWLNDNVINFYMNLLIERGKNEKFPKAYAFNTFFYPKLIREGYNSLRRWTRRIDLFSYDIVAVPIHLQVHWCMAIIDFRDKSVKYYDSMGTANKKCLDALNNYLKSEHKDKKGSDYDMNDWKLESVRDIPQQMNGSDCGVFACTFAEFLTRDAELTFGQENMPYLRRKMVYEILTKKLMIS